MDDRPANVPVVHPDEGRGAREAAAVAPALLVRGVSKHRGKIRVVVADATVVEARAHGLALTVELKLGDFGIGNVRGRWWCMYVYEYVDTGAGGRRRPGGSKTPK